MTANSAMDCPLYEQKFLIIFFEKVLILLKNDFTQNIMQSLYQKNEKDLPPSINLIILTKSYSNILLLFDEITSLR